MVICFVLEFETKKYAETLKIPVEAYIITVGDYKTTITYVCMKLYVRLIQQLKQL